MAYESHFRLALVSPDPSATPPFVASLDVLVTTNQQGVYLVLLPTGGVAEVDLEHIYSIAFPPSQWSKILSPQGLVSEGNREAKLMGTGPPLLRDGETGYRRCGTTSRISH